MASKKNKKRPVAVKLAKTVGKSAPEGSPMSSTRRILILVAAVLVVALLVGGVLLAVKLVRENKDGSTITPTEAGYYNYAGLKLKDYISFGKNDYTGVTVDLEKYFDKYLTAQDMIFKAMDDDYVNEYIDYLLLSLRKPANGTTTPETLVNGTIGYGDDVYIFVLSVTAVKDGETVDAYNDAFVNAYVGVKTIRIGDWFVGEEFDEELIGKNPKDTKYTERTHVLLSDIKDADAVRLFYTATIDGKKSAHTSVSGTRFEAKDELVQKFIENGKKQDGTSLYTGETVKFDLVEDIDGDGKTETVHYSGQIISVMEEKSAVATVTLPENYFFGEDYEEYFWLNGSEVTIEYIVTSFADYDAKRVADLDRALIDEIVKATGMDLVLKADKTDNAASVAEFRSYVKEELTKQKTEALEKYRQAALWMHLAESLTFTKLPADAVALHTSVLTNEVKSLYEYNAYYDAEFAATYPTIDSFASVYCGYDKEEYASFAEYAKKMAEDETKYYLLAYAVVDEMNLKITNEDRAAAREEWLERMSAYYQKQPADILELFGNYVDKLVEQTAVIAKAEGYLFDNNNFDYGEYAEEVNS